MARFLKLIAGTIRAVVGLAALFGAALAAIWLWAERGRLIQPSTRRFLAGFRDSGRPVAWHEVLHGYVYARWPYLYIRTAIRQLFPSLKPAGPAQGWDEVYHGKVLPTGLAKKLITINQPIPRTELEQIIPYPTARTIVLQGSPEIAVIDCPCRSARDNPCQPIQVCLIVGQPFVDFVLEHEPAHSRRLTQAEAVALLEAEHARGHIHAAYFKDAMLDRFYAICNCCVCCCGGLEAMRERGVPMVISSGFVAQVDADCCSACGTCETVCPFGAITVEDAACIDAAVCMGCGVCEDQCAQEAIALVRDASKPAPLDVDRLA